MPQNEYEREFEKFKNVELVVGDSYIIDNRIRVTLVEYDFEKNSCVVLKESGNSMTKTAHWARKNLKHIL